MEFLKNLIFLVEMNYKFDRFIIESLETIIRKSG